MKSVIYAAAIVSAVVVFLVIGVGTSWFGLVASRPMATYAKETERQVYQNSIARQQGAINGIAQDCANMESVTGTDAKAFARFVLTDAAAYAGDRGLSADTTHCISEAHAALAQQGN